MKKRMYERLSSGSCRKRCKGDGKTAGTYITIEAPDLSVPDEDYHREISEEISKHLKQLIDLKKEKSILVVGLGNAGITADALGPHVVENLRMTRHIIREYGLGELIMKNAPCQWNCAGSDGTDRYGNCRDHTGSGCGNETGCSSCN